MSRARRGVVLLEALVAMTLLVTVATVAIAVTAESARAVARAREREQEMRDANAFLSAVALWPREDLDRHLGTRKQGTWLMHVDRVTATLYGVTLTTANPPRSLLETALYRPE
jgi:type II secretory pathway pseudopilin PulG